MRTFLVPAVLAASLALGSAAFAAPTAPHAAAPAAATKASVAKAATTRVAHNGKQQGCEASWKTQKSHNGTRAAFMKACVAKG